MCLTKIKSENFSHAQVAARASFLIYVYRISVSNIERDAKATGLHRPSVFGVILLPSHMLKHQHRFWLEQKGHIRLMLWVWRVLPLPGKMPLTERVPKSIFLILTAVHMKSV